MGRKSRLKAEQRQRDLRALETRIAELEAHLAQLGERVQPEESTRPAFPDPRLLTVAVTAVDGVPVTEETFVFPVDRLRLPSGQIVAWHAASIPAFYLVTAKQLRDEGEDERVRVVASVEPTSQLPGYADVNVTDDSLAMDALGKLGSAVILAAAAVEAYANDAIDRLDPEETVEIVRRGRVTVTQPEMVRRLRLDEKLDLVAPRVGCAGSIKGQHAWELFLRLNELRGEVVHVKARGRTDDPDIPSVLGRLLAGEGSRCIEDAFAIISACEPTYPLAGVL